MEIERAVDLRKDVLLMKRPREGGELGMEKEFQRLESIGLTLLDANTLADLLPHFVKFFSVAADLGLFEDSKGMVIVTGKDGELHEIGERNVDVVFLRVLPEKRTEKNATSKEIIEEHFLLDMSGGTTSGTREWPPPEEPSTGEELTEHWFMGGLHPIGKLSIGELGWWKHPGRLGPSTEEEMVEEEMAKEKMEEMLRPFKRLKGFENKIYLRSPAVLVRDTKELDLTMWDPRWDRRKPCIDIKEEVLVDSEAFKLHKVTTKFTPSEKPRMRELGWWTCPGLPPTKDAIDVDESDEEELEVPNMQRIVVVEVSWKDTYSAWRMVLMSSDHVGKLKSIGSVKHQSV